VAVASLAGLSVFGPKTSYAANPTTINFQGKVVRNDTGNEGTNVANGTYSITFRLYNNSGTNPNSTTCALGGTCLWEETQASVTVTNGVFQVELGTSCSFFVSNACNKSAPIDFNSSNALYLTMKFNSDAQGYMTPMMHFQSVPYAYNADKLGGLASSAFGQLTAASQTWTGTNTFQPSTNITSTIVKQTSAGSPTADIFNVQTANGTNILQATGPSANNSVVTLQSVGSGNALTLTSAAATTWSTAAGLLTLQGASGITLTATGSNVLTLDSGSSGTISIGATNATTTVGRSDAALTLNGNNFSVSSAGLITSQTSSYTTDQLLINDGQVTAHPAYPNSYTPALSVVTNETTGSRPLFFGYNNAGSWDGFLTTGACGSFTQMCLDFGSGATAHTALQSSGTTLRVGSGSDGDFSSIAMGPTIAASTVDILTVSNSGFGTSTTGADGLYVNFATAGTTNSADNAGLRIDVTSGNNGTTTTLEGLRIGNLAGAQANATETGVYIGTGWDIGLDLNSGGIQLGVQSNPTVPAAGELRVWAKLVSGRTMLKGMGPSGVDYAYQPSLFQQQVCLITVGANTSSALLSTTGCGTTNVGTITTAAMAEATGYLANQVTGTTIGNTAGTGTNVASNYRGSVANGASGFFFFARVELPDALAKYSSTTTGSRIFVGMTDQTMAVSVGSTDPTGNRAGFSMVPARDTPTFNWKFVTKNGATENAVDTGVTLAVVKTYDMYVYVPPLGGTINWRIDNLTDGSAPVEGSTSTNLPTATVAMRGGLQIATLEAVAHNVRWQRIYIESDR
jgi:hypothetical protein